MPTPDFKMTKTGNQFLEIERNSYSKSNLSLLNSSWWGIQQSNVGAGWQCGYPNICPGFVPCQNMSNQCLTYVFILSLPSIWLVFGHNTQLLSSKNPIFVLSANFYLVFVPKFFQFFTKSITKWQDQTWTKIGLNCFNMNHLVTLYVDIRWTNAGHS